MTCLLMLYEAIEVRDSVEAEWKENCAIGLGATMTWVPNPGWPIHWLGDLEARCLTFRNMKVHNPSKEDNISLFILFYFILFIHKRQRERGRDTGRGRSRLPAGSPMQDSIPGPRDHDLS